MVQNQLMQNLRPVEISSKDVTKIVAWAESCHLDSGRLDQLNQRGSQTRDEAFKDFGFDDPEGIEIMFVANQETVDHFVIPSDPNATMSDESLEGVAGGACGSTVASILGATGASTLGCIG